MSRVPVFCALLLMAFLLGVNVYRAATQSITTDEAFTFHRYVNQPLAKTFTEYDANNHVLHTLLVKLCAWLLGGSEIVLRIPALCGGLLYFAAVYRICRLAFGQGWLFLLAVAMLSLNPFVLDYLSIARGYGMSMALLLAAFEQLLRYLREPNGSRRLYTAAVALALAVGANLTAVFPGLALAGAFTALHLGEAAAARNFSLCKERAARVSDHLLVPGLVLAVAIVIFPLRNAARENFYVGAKDFFEVSVHMARASLWRVGNPLEKTAAGPAAERALDRFGQAGVPLILLAGGVLAANAVRRERRVDGILTLLGATTAALLLIHFLALRWFGVLYPFRRTGLYWAPLFTLLVMALAAQAGRFAPLAAVVPGIGLAVFLSSWTVRFYDEWTFDAGTKELARTLAERIRGRDEGSVRVGANWIFEQSLNYYRIRFRMKAMVPVTDKGPDGEYDYYLLMPADWPMAERRGLRVIREHDFSRAVLAEPDPAKLPK